MTEDGQLRRSRVAVDGIESVVVEAGPAGAAEAVVFLHGNPGSSWEWIPYLGPVGSFVRAVAVDMPGFGRADKPRALPYTIEGFTAHLTGLLEALGVTRAHLVLHDFGAAWGLRWADRHRESLGSVVVVDTGVLTGYRGHVLWWLWCLPVLPELAMTRRIPRGVLARLLARGTGSLPAPYVDRTHTDLDAGTGRAILGLYRSTARGIVANPTTNQPRGGRFEVPGLVLWGARDPYIKARYANGERVWFRSADLHVFPGSGHWPHVDDPEGFSARLLPFLRRQTAPVTLPT